MKKAILGATVAALVLAVSAPAFAAPDFSLDGQYRLRYTNQDAYTGNSVDHRVRLTGKLQVTDDITVKGRAVSTWNNTSASDLDQYSVRFQLDKSTALLAGQDDLWVGNGLFFDNWFKHANLTTKIGAVDAQFVYADDEDLDLNSMKLINGQTTFGKTAVGGFYAKSDDFKLMGVNAAYTFDKVTLAAEFGKESDSSDKFFLATATFGQLAKKGDTNYVFEYHKIDNTGAYDITTNSTLDVPGYKGYSVTVNHKFDKNAKVALEQHFNKDAGGEDRTRVVMIVNF